MPYQHQLRSADEAVRLQLVVTEAVQTGDCPVRVLLTPSPTVLQRTPMRHIHHRIPSGTPAICFELCAAVTHSFSSDVGLEDMAASLSRARASGSDRRSAANPARAFDAAGACIHDEVCGFDTEDATHTHPPIGAVAEKWGPKVARLRRTSPFGHLSHWALRPVIVKSGDDCRQELMAVQIVSKLQTVFSDAGLPLWLRPFEVCLPASDKRCRILTELPCRSW